jgi:hypothetical protein
MNISPRERFLFLECSGKSEDAAVSRVMKRERERMTYCIKRTEYEWVSGLVQRSGYGRR